MEHEPARPHPTISAPGKPGVALIAELDALRDANRLGIHMAETGDCFAYPHALQAWLAAGEPNVAAATPTLSLSLLPAKAAGFSLLPYDIGPGFGYLLDLREDQPEPPRILGAHHATMTSGDNVFAKKLMAEWSGTSLDTMAKTYAATYAGEEYAPFNEVQAHLQRSHVRAIVVPLTLDGPSGLPGADAYHRLHAAMLGLIHLETDGTTPPVVLYNIKGPNRNGFHYIGHSEAELKAAAMDALREVVHSKQLMDWIDADMLLSSSLWETIDHHLGVDAVEQASQKTGQGR